MPGEISRSYEGPAGPEWDEARKAMEEFVSGADPAKCPHPDFEAQVTVNRLEDSGRFMADVQVRCAACHTPFRFIGLPAGCDPNSPCVSVDATEARMPIAPRGQVLSELEGTPIGFTIRKTV